MCNCRELPPFVVEINCREHGPQLTGLSYHHRYFEIPDSEFFEPPLDHSHSMYRCAECGQMWYFELWPEQTPWPEFALKVDDLTRSPSEQERRAARQYLCILAHGGFDSEKCRMAGCHNHKLLGREICHLHFSFP